MIIDSYISSNKSSNISKGSKDWDGISILGFIIDLLEIVAVFSIIKLCQRFWKRSMAEDLITSFRV